MGISTRTRATFGAAIGLSLIGAVAWAQNLDVKGSAWVATGGSGSAGVGTAAPLGKLHVVAPGGFGPENADGTSQPGNVPILAQSDGSAFGLLNGSGRQVFALIVEGNGLTAGARGYPVFYDKQDGVWRSSLFLAGGNAGVGLVPAPAYRLDVAGDVHAAGWVRTEGAAGWYSQTYGGGWYMSEPLWIRTYNQRSIWTGGGFLGGDGGLTVGYGGLSPPGGGAIVAGNAGVGTASPAFKLDVRGAIGAGNSDVYFTHPGHLHTGIGNTPGYAAIENASDYGTLMILGRAGTAFGRKVDVWDYLQVNGRIRATAGLAVYRQDGRCPAGGTLTTSATCVWTTPCPLSPSSVCNSGTATNPLVGRLVDP